MVCGKDQPTNDFIKTEKFEVLGDEIEASITVRVCLRCNEEVWDENLERANQKSIYDKYRRKLNLLLPEEIKAIRDHYGLSQKSFAKLLGFGDKTITRYENGSIQDRSHDLLMRLMDSKECFITAWNVQKGQLSPDDISRVEIILNS